MSNYLLLNGPNLNLLGSREPEIYGSTSLADIESQLLRICLEANHSLDSFQSNAEHDLVNKIHEAKDANVKKPAPLKKGTADRRTRAKRVKTLREIGSTAYEGHLDNYKRYQDLINIYQHIYDSNKSINKSLVKFTENYK